MKRIRPNKAEPIRAPKVYPLERNAEQILRLYGYQRYLSSFKYVQPKDQQNILADLRADEPLVDLLDVLQTAQSHRLAALYLIEQGAVANASKTYEVTESKEGRLVVMFMKIGSGDCIFIKTPKGDVIVEDCGTRASPKDRAYVKEISDMLNSELFLGGKTSLHALILTHADEDHHNEISAIFPDTISIKNVYHSDDLGSYSEIGSGTKSAHDFVGSHSARVNRVTICTGETKVVPPQATQGERYTINTVEQWIEILKDDTCNIKLLASEVLADTRKTRDRYKGGSKLVGDIRKKRKLTRGVGERENSGSIVTLIEAYNRKVLLVGDATYSTEMFLMEKHKARIKDISLAQVEHHGSGTAHAGNEYVETIDPILAAISSGDHSNDFNPRWRAIKKYLGIKGRKPDRAVRLASPMDEHAVQNGETRSWRTGDDDLWAKGYKNKGLYSTYSSNDLCFIVEKNGDLVREFYEKKKDSEDTEKRRYSIGLNGVLTRT